MAGSGDLSVTTTNEKLSVFHSSPCWEEAAPRLRQGCGAGSGSYQPPCSSARALNRSRSPDSTGPDSSATISSTTCTAHSWSSESSSPANASRTTRTSENPSWASSAATSSAVSRSGKTSRCSLTGRVCRAVGSVGPAAGPPQPGPFGRGGVGEPEPHPPLRHLHVPDEVVPVGGQRQPALHHVEGHGPARRLALHPALDCGGGPPGALDIAPLRVD